MTVWHSPEGSLKSVFVLIRKTSSGRGSYGSGVRTMDDFPQQAVRRIPELRNNGSTFRVLRGEDVRILY